MGTVGVMELAVQAVVAAAEVPDRSAQFAMTAPVPAAAVAAGVGREAKVARAGAVAAARSESMLPRPWSVPPLRAMGRWPIAT
jgi:hypothetical protein